MESTGILNRIHLSKDTADLLVEAGKTRWLEPREDIVEVKGKGRMATFWLSTVRERLNSLIMDVPYDPVTGKKQDDRHDRLIEWNVDELFGILKKVVARRKATVSSASIKEEARRRSKDVTNYGVRVAFDDVKEVVTLPKFDPSLPGQTAEDAADELSPLVRHELRDYVSQIAAGYKNNPFHNFGKNKVFQSPNLGLDKKA
jgi:hypothetical protein